MKIYLTYLLISTFLGFVWLYLGLKGLDISTKQMFYIGLSFGCFLPLMFFCINALQLLIK